MVYGLELSRMTEKLLTLKEAAKVLSVPPEEVEKWVQEGRLPAFQIAGEYLRFRRGELERFKRERLTAPEVSPPQPQPRIGGEYTLLDGVRDFFYFNDFYLISFVLALVALWAILTL